MTVIKIILFIIGILSLYVGQYLWGIVFIFVALCIPSKKKRMKKKMRAQQNRSPVTSGGNIDPRYIEDCKKQILVEMQMCQQRIIALEMNIRNCDCTSFWGTRLAMKDIDNYNAERNHLIELQEEYDRLSRL